VTTRLVVVRHGRSEWNASGRFQGQQESELDDVGRAQALASAEVLSRVAPSLVLSSTSRRAVDTAEAIGRAAGVRAEADPDLREIALGGWEGLTRAEIEVAFPDEFDAWQAGRDVRRGGGETYAECGARAWACLEPRLSDDGGPVVVVTHGGTARGLLSVLLGIRLEPHWPFEALRNAHWATLDRDATRGWRLAEYNVGPS
jgi:probable phosphoglycerate mutase